MFLFIANGLILCFVQASGVFSETVKVIAMRDVQSVTVDGRTVSIAMASAPDAPFALIVVLASECHEQLSVRASLGRCLLAC